MEKNAYGRVVEAALRPLMELFGSASNARRWLSLGANVMSEDGGRLYSIWQRSFLTNYAGSPTVGRARATR
jgi:hypothetical protein